MLRDDEKPVRKATNMPTKLVANPNGASNITSGLLLACMLGGRETPPSTGGCQQEHTMGIGTSGTCGV